MKPSPARHSPDLPFLLWAVFPHFMLLLLIFLAYFNPEFFQLMMAKDDEGGIVEHATVLILLPGIAAGFAVFLYHRQNLPSPWLFQKPQALVEIWIVAGGLILPLWRRFKKNTWLLSDQTWQY